MDMMISLPELYSQIQSLSALVAKQTARIDELEKLIAEKDLLIAKQAALIQHYEAQILFLKRRQFGASSERIDSDLRQLSIFSDIFMSSETSQLPTLATEEVTYTRKKRKGKREEDLSALPVVRVDYELTGDERNCPSCETDMRDIGVALRREIEIIPAQAILKEHAAHSYACPNPKCKGTEENDSLGGSQIIVRADSPKPLISGSLASPSLVAHIAYQKYSNGMPLYRIEKGFLHDGVTISRQNMSNWVINCSQMYLMSVYERLKHYLLQEAVLHSDGTTIQVLREEGRAATTKSCEWAYRTSGASAKKIIIYEYTQTKGQEHPKRFLKDFKGYLHTDGAQTYHNLTSDIIVVGCWAHARRYFENIVKPLDESSRKSSDASVGLAYINALFKLERDFDKLSNEERYLARLEKSKPIADDFFAWVDSLGALPKSPLGKATHYAISQRKYLESIFTDGRLELSNNRCERSIKPFVQGRKAWLFSNTPDGAEASSVMYSLIETAKENGLHPFHYLRFLLDTLPSSTCNNVDELLPWSEALPDWCRMAKQ